MFLTDWRRTRNCRVSQYEHEQMRPSWRRLAVSSYLFLSAVTWSGSHSSWLDGSHGIKTCFMAESRGWIYASHSPRKETALRSFGTLSKKKKKNQSSLQPLQTNYLKTLYSLKVSHHEAENRLFVCAREMCHDESRLPINCRTLMRDEPEQAKTAAGDSTKTGLKYELKWRGGELQVERHGETPGVGNEWKNTKNIEGADRLGRTAGAGLMKEEMRCRCGGENRLARSTGGKGKRTPHKPRGLLKRKQNEATGPRWEVDTYDLIECDALQEIKPPGDIQSS